MKNKIRPPVKIDQQGRVIRDPKVRAHSWRLNVPASITGTRKERKFFATEAEAKTYAADLLKARKDAGDLIQRLKARGMSITEALEYALKHAPIKGSKSIDQACEAFLASRRDSNCKERYLANLTSQFLPFREEFGSTMTDAINKAQLERFLAGLTGKDGDTPATPKTRVNFIITLTALFNYAVEEGWRGENPAVKIRRPALDEVATAILTPNEVKLLLDEASKPEYVDVFPALLVQLFAGPRRSEIPHITWDNLRDQYLRLDKTKVRKKRAIELPEVLLVWLAPLQKQTGLLFAPDAVEFDPKDTRNVEDAYTYRLSEIAEAAKVILPKNVLRHTAITYRDAFTGDHSATAAWAGNSPRIIEQHYRGAATKEDAMKFYALKPGPAENVVPFQKPKTA